MRIAMLTNNYKPYVGGVPISIERLADGLRALNHEVYIFAPSYGNEKEEPFVIRYKGRKKRLKGEFIVPYLFENTIEKTFSSLAFDVIHVHHPMMMGYTAQYLGKKYDIPVVFTYHTRYEQYLHYLAPFEKIQKYCNKGKHPRVKTLVKKLLWDGGEKLITVHNRIFTNQCDLVFAPTPSMKKYLEDHGTINVEVMPTGISHRDFEFDPLKAQEIREKFRKNDTHLFCSVSRLEKEKNIDFILEGMRLYKERKGNGFKLLLIGDGSYRPELEKRVEELGLAGNIVFLGRIPHDDIADYYHATDLFVFASESETQGIVLLEAMASGLPVVAVTASGVSDVVEDGVNGYVTDKDPELWEQRIEQAVSNKGIYEKMRLQALKKARQYLSDTIATHALRSYQYVLFLQGMEKIHETKKDDSFKKSHYDWKNIS